MFPNNHTLCCPPQTPHSTSNLVSEILATPLNTLQVLYTWLQDHVTFCVDDVHLRQHMRQLADGLTVWAPAHCRQMPNPFHQMGLVLTYKFVIQQRTS